MRQKGNQNVQNLINMEKNIHGFLPLMPKATAIWLIENTLDFEQIADFGVSSVGNSSTC